MVGALTIDSFWNTWISPYRWIVSSVWPQHIYSHFLDCTLVHWFPFSLLVGDLASVNGIHQWPVIRRWTTMFDLDNSIHIVGYVLVAVCVKDLLYWWHLIYASSLMVPVFMRFQLSWLDSSICQTFPAIMEILIHYISSVFMEIMILCISSSWRFWSIYIVHGDDHICHIVSCLSMAIVLLCIWDCYMYLQLCVELYHCIVLIGWLILPLGSSSLQCWDGIIMYFSHRMTALTSHIRGHLL